MTVVDLGPELLREILDPAMRHAVIRGASEVVRRSFDEDDPPMRQVTGREVQRRVRLCWAAFKMLRHDLRWSIDRALHALPEKLRADLDGREWKPSERASFVPTIGALARETREAQSSVLVDGAGRPLRAG